MLRTYSISDGKIVEAPDGNGKIMVFVAPDEEEKRRLTVEYNIDEHTLHSSLDPDELARLEFEPEHAAIIYKRPRNFSAQEGTTVFKVASSGLFLFKDRLIVVQPEDISLLLVHREDDVVPSLGD